MCILYLSIFQSELVTFQSTGQHSYIGKTYFLENWKHFDTGTGQSKLVEGEAWMCSQLKEKVRVNRLQLIDAESRMKEHKQTG